MKTPVIIAARDEQVFMGETLWALPPEVEPIVVTNGSSDATADIARLYKDVVVLELDEAGKIPAQQAALEYLGDRALEPILMLDADSFPVLGPHWATAMLKARQRFPANEAVIISGPAIYRNMSVPGAIYKSLTDVGRQVEAKFDESKESFCGRNSLMHLTPKALEQVLQLGNIWPGADTALKDEILKAGGKTYKSLNPLAAVWTDGSRYPNLGERLRLGRNGARNKVMQSYLDDAAPDTTSYFQS